MHSTSINRETLPKRSPSSNSGPLQNWVAVLGGGHGLAAALRDDGAELTAIVTVADDGGSSGELRRRTGGPAVGDLRRSLVALGDGEVALTRAFNLPLTVDRLGRHPLGNLLILSLASAFGDLEKASEWLCERLGIGAVVLPATIEPVSLVADAGGKLIHGESAIGATRAKLRRLHFSPARPTVPDAVPAAIEHADWVLLAPGSLFTSVLAASALPDVARALRAPRRLWCGSVTSTRTRSRQRAWQPAITLRSCAATVFGSMRRSTIRAQSCTSKLSSSRVKVSRRFPARSAPTGLACTTRSY